VLAAPHRVVVVGGGFGGLQAALALSRAPVEVTVVDRRNFHLFQPLTYQVATGALSPDEIAYPLRAMFRRHANVRVVLGEVCDVDLDARACQLRPVSGLPAPDASPYDSLIVAGGSHYSYFGHDEWSEYAMEVKSLESALRVRGRILGAFEAAETEGAGAPREAWLTFVIVGGGPTGVEMAGQIGELARDTMRRDFRAFDPRVGRILLIEAMDRVLTGFPPSLSAKAERSLRRLGVTPMLSRTVVGVDEDGVSVQDSAGAVTRIASRTVIWAAGVAACPLARRLSELTGAELDRAGRVVVGPDLTLPGHPEVFALGDMARVRNPDGSTEDLPGMAPVAMQQGRYAAEVVCDRLRGQSSAAFRYHDKGNLATIGRGAAVAEIKRLRLSGFIAWLAWATIHIAFLPQAGNRLMVFTQWAWSYVTKQHGARLILEPRVTSGKASSTKA
jgi:NADH dehydrogenase